MTNIDPKKEKIKNAVRGFYDIQKLRMQSGARSTKKAKDAEAFLDDHDKEFLTKTSKGLNQIERMSLAEIERLLQDIPIYNEFLKDVKGVGPTMAGVIVSEFYIEKCDTVSQMWAWAGLAVRDGKADRRVKGQKCRFNPWLKSKMVKVLAECLLRAVSLDAAGYYTKIRDRDENGNTFKVPAIDENGDKILDKSGKPKMVYAMKRVPWEGDSPYRKFYDDYKHRKENQKVETCAMCNGTGKMSLLEKDIDLKHNEKRPSKKTKCNNCNGTGGPAPWGKSQQHRHNAAIRYMVKMFLRELWNKWRELEGLEVRPPYEEEYLGIVHHRKRA